MQMFAYRHTEAGIRRREALAVRAIAPVEAEPEAIETTEIEEAPAEDIRQPIWTPRIGLHGIIASVADEYGTTLAEVLGRSRRHVVVKARTAAVATIRQQRPEMSLPQLGALFNRDHTTILHLLRKHASFVTMQHGEPG